jgi:hypothetical protein
MRAAVNSRVLPTIPRSDKRGRLGATDGLSMTGHHKFVNSSPTACKQEPSHLPVMLVSARAGVGYNNLKGGRAFGGVLDCKRNCLRSTVVPPDRIKHNESGREDKRTHQTTQRLGTVIAAGYI